MNFFKTEICYNPTISSLYLLHQTHKQWISNVDITIVNLEASGNGDLLLIQEAQCEKLKLSTITCNFFPDIKDVTYTELVPMPGFFETVTIDSRVKKSALIIGYQVNQTLVAVKMDDVSFKLGKRSHRKKISAVIHCLYLLWISLSIHIG